MAGAYTARRLAGESTDEQMMDNRLQQAIRTLRAIRQRYETESDASSGRRRSFTIQVALGDADMRWLAAAIEALEKTNVSNRVPSAAIGG